MADILKFPQRLRGNGAREAVLEVLNEPAFLWPRADLSVEDRFLGLLWQRGFKVIPTKIGE